MCSCNLHRIQVRDMDILLPGKYLSPFLKMGEIFPFNRSDDKDPSSKNLEKRI